MPVNSEKCTLVTPLNFLAYFFTKNEFYEIL